MAARTLLLKLERRNLLVLPPRQSRGGTGSRKAVPPGAAEPQLLPEEPIGCRLAELLPLRIDVVEGLAQRHRLRQLLSRYHYLGYQRAVGQNLSYLVFDRQQRLLSALVFGAAAWKCAPRDRWIGWDPLARQAHLHQVANNMRFLILPWVQVPGLGSHVLARVAQGLSEDWQQKYGHRIYLLETFVEQQRFEATCYRAANWIAVGQTQGRSRNDRERLLQVPCKGVYLCALSRRCRQLLQQEQGPELAPMGRAATVGEPALSCKLPPSGRSDVIGDPPRSRNEAAELLQSEPKLC